jgi:hypothetical protein
LQGRDRRRKVGQQRIEQHPLARQCALLRGQRLVLEDLELK